jgi:Lon protease-like protein
MSEPSVVIPVFPLPDVVLFPKLHLPLHISERRYRPDGARCHVQRASQRYSVSESAPKRA